MPDGCATTKASARQPGAERSPLEWLAGASTDVAFALAANRDELRSRGAVIGLSLCLSPFIWITGSVLKFGTSTVVIGTAAVVSLLLVALLGAVDRDNSLHALRRSGRDLLEGPPEPFARARRMVFGLARGTFPLLDCILVSIVVLPMAFAADVENSRARAFQLANAPIRLEATSRVDVEERRLRTMLAREEAVLAEIIAEGHAVRNLGLPQTQVVDAEIRRRIQVLAAERAEAARRQQQFELDRRAEIDGARLQPHNSGRPGRGERAIAAELQAAAEAREADRLGVEISRLEVQAEALKAAESRRVDEALRNRAQRIARYEYELRSATARHAEAAKSLKDAMEARSSRIDDLVAADPRFTPQEQPGIAADLAVLVRLAVDDPVRGFVCLVASLTLLSVLLMGPITAMRPVRNGYAVRLADADATEIEAVVAEATLRRTGFRRRMTFAGLAASTPRWTAA